MIWPITKKMAQNRDGQNSNKLQAFKGDHISSVTSQSVQS